MPDQIGYSPSTGQKFKMVGGNWQPLEAAPSAPAKPPAAPAPKAQPSTLDNIGMRIVYSMLHGPASTISKEFFDIPKLGKSKMTKETYEQDPISKQWKPLTPFTEYKLHVAQFGKDLSKDVKKNPQDYFPGTVLDPVGIAAFAAGTGEAFSAGLVSMAGQMDSAFAGAKYAVMSLLNGAPLSQTGDNFTTGKRKFDTAWNEVIDPVAKPETKWGKQLYKALGLGVEAFHYAGESTFQTLHQAGAPPAVSAAAGAGVEVIGDALAIAGPKNIKSGFGTLWNKVSPKGDKPIQRGFDDLAGKNAPAAHDIANAMKEVDPELAAELKQRIKDVTLSKQAVDDLMNPKRFQQPKAKAAKSTDSVVVGKEQLDKMFDPERLAARSKESQIDQAHVQRMRYEAAKKQFEETEAWNAHEKAKEALSRQSVQGVLAEGPWTQLASGREMHPEVQSWDKLFKGEPLRPHEATAMSNAFEKALFGSGQLHSFLSPFSQHVWDELKGAVHSSRDAAGRLIHPTAEGVLNFWDWASRGRLLTVGNKPEPFYHATAAARWEEPIQDVWFSNNPAVANSYVFNPEVAKEKYENMFKAGGREYAPTVIRAYLRPKRPLVVDAQGSDFRSVPFPPELAMHKSALGMKKATTEYIAGTAKEMGYDGVLFKNIIDTILANPDDPLSDVAVILHKGKPYEPPEEGNIKSALGNNGRWSEEPHLLRMVIGPEADKDLIQKAVGAAASVALGAGNPSLREALEGSKYTLKTLERLPNKREVPVATIMEQLNRQDVTKSEKETVGKMLEGWQGETIPAQELVKRFQLATSTHELGSSDSTRWAAYGLENIDRGEPPENAMDFAHKGQGVAARTTIWQLPYKLQQSNHFDDPRYYAHTRTFKENGVQHVVEIQSDLVQNAGKISEEERARIKPLFDSLQEQIRKTSLNMQATRSHEEYEALNKKLEQLRVRSAELQNKLNATSVPSALSALIPHWYRRVIGEELKRAADAGDKVKRFATADTVAKVEGWPRRVDPGHEDKLKPQHQSIYDRYNKEIAGHLRKLGGHNVTDSLGHTWIEVPLEQFRDKRIDMYGTTMLYSALTPFDPRALKDAYKLLRKIPGYRAAENSARIVAQELLATVYPEGLSDRARLTAATLAKGMSMESHIKSIIQTNDRLQDAYWEGKSEPERMRFLNEWESGRTPSNPHEAQILKQYRDRMNAAYDYDMSIGLKEYEPLDNYVYHLWDNGPEAEKFFAARYGVKWGDPKFTKGREIELIKEGIKNGLRLKYTKPSDIVQAREFASLVAGMRVKMLDELAKGGMAIEKKWKTVNGKQVATKQPSDTIAWRSPNGKLYYVYTDAAQVLHNAFNSKSLWSDPGIRGMGFRGWMYLKNHAVPVILSFSAFHPLHIGLGMDFASEGTRLFQQLSSNKLSPAEFTARYVKALAIVPGQWERSRTGLRWLDIWNGKETNLKPEEQQALTYMHEGGFTPLSTQEFNTRAIAQFKGALKRGAYLTAGWKLPWAMLEGLSYPVFQKWIPALKAANYIEDVKTALATDPSLLNDSAKRAVRLRQISKSIDNRFGEMAYNQLFWNRWVRDIGQASALALGWKLGFVREFGGQPLEALKAAGEVVKGKPLGKAIAEGELNKTLFVGQYVAMALAVGGLMTYALTGQLPQDIKDYIYPRIGGENPNGSPKRVNTMFYTREYAGLWTHMQNQGVGAGLSQYVINAAAPNFKIANTFLTGLDYRGREIYDPNAPEWKQIMQKTQTVLGDLDPISVETFKRDESAKGRALGFLGFSPAPAYATESPLEGKIKTLSGYYNKHITPFERAQYGDEASALRQAIRAHDHVKAQEAIQSLKKYGLSAEQLDRIVKSATQDPLVGMFKRLSPEQQVKLIKGMTPEEKRKFLPNASPQARRLLRKEEEQ